MRDPKRSLRLNLHPSTFILHPLSLIFHPSSFIPDLLSLILRLPRHRGLAGEHNRLAAEWNVTMGPADKLRFVEMIRGEIVIGRFFAPNIEALREEYARRVAAQEPRPRG